MLKILSRMTLIFMLAASPELAQAPQQPLTQEEVRDLIKTNIKKNADQISKTLSQRKVDFDLDRDIEKKMRRAGATDDILQEIWKAGPTYRNAKSSLLTGPTGARIEASYEEAMGFQTIQNEMDPDRAIRMVNEFEQRFPKSQCLSYVYTLSAKAYQQKGDFAKAVDYGEKSVKLDPDNTFSLVIVALSLSQPRELQGSPEESNKRLTEAATDASHALALIDKLDKRPNETDEQFQQRKGAIAADAHFALGAVRMHQEDFDKAVAEYKAAISSSPRPSFQYYYRLGEAYASEGQTAQAIEVLHKASDVARGTPMQKYADDFIAELQNKPH
jgi:tetratricopeptide (TPR) repeat protein